MIKINMKYFVQKWLSSNVRQELNASECAAILGVSGATLSKIEAGKMGPGLETFFSMCEVGNMNHYSFLLNRDEIQQKTLEALNKARNNRIYDRQMSELRNRKKHI